MTNQDADDTRNAAELQALILAARKRGRQGRIYDLVRESARVAGDAARQALHAVEAICTELAYPDDLELSDFGKGVMFMIGKVRDASAQ